MIQFSWATNENSKFLSSFLENWLKQSIDYQKKMSIIFLLINQSISYNDLTERFHQAYNKDSRSYEIFIIIIFIIILI